ncbi:MAG TPA: hypothetical protein DCW87_06565 [Comamonadaceae bacterium]|nr:hypothetical protein [Comamonadaceae bacterium]
MRKGDATSARTEECWRPLRGGRWPGPRPFMCCAAGRMPLNCSGYSRWPGCDLPKEEKKR